MIRSVTLTQIVFWIGRQILLEDLNQKWLSSFINNRYQILTTLLREIVGERFSVISSRTVHAQDYDRVVVEVQRLVHIMPYNVFVRFRQWNLLEPPGKVLRFITGASRFVEENILLLRLLRLHRDVNLRPTIDLPDEWPCQRVNVLLNNLNALPNHMHPSSLLAMHQLATGLGDRARDVFNVMPQWTARGGRKAWIANHVLFKLCQMSIYDSVDSVINELDQQGLYGIDQELEKHYFRTAEGA